MVTHRFAKTDELDFHSCKNEGYVNEEEARALYLAAKQRPVTKMKKVSRH